jgi:hypothetical protein
MRSLSLGVYALTVVILLVCSFATAQQRDPSAIAFLNRAVTAAGGSTAISAIQDFTAQGTMTYFWSNQEQGQSTIKSRGLSQFRIDTALPEGTWSYIVNNAAGEFALPNGPVIALAGHNTFNAGALTLPICTINAATLDSTATIIDMGTVKFGSAVVRQIRIQRSLPGDTNGSLSKLTRRDFFFDPTSSLLVEIQDAVHPPADAVNGTLLHVLDFGNYQKINGIVVPFSVTETLNGQQTWTVQLSSLVFNTGLSDADFQF